MAAQPGTPSIGYVVSGLLALLTALVSFTLAIVDLRKKSKSLFGVSLREIKRYAAFLTLFLAAISILLGIKSDLDGNIKKLKDQMAVLDRLTQILSVTDVISGSTLTVSWKSNND